MVKFGSLLLVGGFWGVDGFAPRRNMGGPRRTRNFSGLKSFSGADSLMDKLDSVAVPTPDDAAPVLEKVIEAPPLPEVTDAIEVTTSVPEVQDILGGLPLDLPLPLIGGVVVAAVAAAVVLSGGKSGPSSAEKASSVVEPTSSTVETAPSIESSYDVSIPYDAAAMLAYEKAGKPGDFGSFKSKYLADTVAMIKSKQKK